MIQKSVFFMAGALLAALVYVSYNKHPISTTPNNSLACAGEPLKTIEARNAALEDGYVINQQFDCIDKASFEAVKQRQAVWEAGRAKRAAMEASFKASQPAPVEAAEVAETPVQAAIKLVEAHDYAKALPIFKAQAELGDAIAQVMLSDMYHNAKGVAKDDKLAFEWASKAAAKLNPQGMSLVALMHEEGWGTPKDGKQAVFWYTEAANEGYVTAQVAVGMRYLTGTGVAKNENSGIYWIQKAARTGDPEAELMYGMALHEGLGNLHQDDKKAKYWLEAAAKQGNAQAKTLLQQLGL